MMRVVVLISGRGSNMLALADSLAGRSDVAIAAVISNEPDAAGLVLASARGLATRAVHHRDYPSRDAFDAALAAVIDEFSPDLIVMAGFMRIVTPSFIARYADRMLNIHPSLLPAYPGLHTHARALADGAEWHGATVHFVTDTLDGGPPVAQVRVQLRAEDTEAELAGRVLEREHVLLPTVVNWFVKRRLVMADGHAELDGQRLAEPVLLED